MRVAILSNINVDSVIKEVDKTYQVLPPEGYGSVLECLLNKSSSYYAFEPQISFILIDIYELVKHEQTLEQTYAQIDSWFETLESTLEGQKAYFLSDVDDRSYQADILESGATRDYALEHYWHNKLDKLCQRPNVFKFPYKRLVTQFGKEAFYSDKLWYLGKIPYTNKAQKAIANEVIAYSAIYQRTPKKVLVLDLDNTLWGGVVGEVGVNGIDLAEDGKGAIYKDFQRVLQVIQQSGVILCIVSKNNEQDALEVFEKHPHNVLRQEDFVVKKINWAPKHSNLIEMAKELNLGLESFVFVDDHPAERESIKALLPQVTVPEFPKAIEELPKFAKEIYQMYFKQLKLTEEDKVKTKQYQDNFKREALKNQLHSFEDFLKSLEIEVDVFKNEAAHLERLYQLIHKTNQFNLTTKRYDRPELQEMLEDTQIDVYTFKVGDKFGDNGIVSAVIVDKKQSVPYVDSFLMSCRVMGKWIENYIIDYIEQAMLKEGFMCLQGGYNPTSKNLPVKDFYKSLDYTEIEEGLYQLDLTTKAKRKYFVKKGEA